MPGKGGMRPDQSSRSVPVLMPLHSTSTTTSSAPGGVEVEPAEREALGRLQHDGERVHSRLRDPGAPAGCHRPVCQATLDSNWCQANTRHIDAVRRGAGDDHAGSAAASRVAHAAGTRSKPAGRSSAVELVRACAAGRCPWPAGRSRNRRRRSARRRACRPSARPGAACRPAAGARRAAREDRQRRRRRRGRG